MSPEQQKLRDEVLQMQQFQKDTGQNVTGIHETERAIMEQRRVQEALEKAQPTFQRDGHGLRGPQEAKPLQLDGADGWGHSIQIKRNRGGADAGGAAASSFPALPFIRVKAIFQDSGGDLSVETVRVSGNVV